MNNPRRREFCLKRSSDQREEQDNQLNFEGESTKYPENKHKKTLLTTSVTKVLRGAQRGSNPRPSEPQSESSSFQGIDIKQLTDLLNSRRTDGRTSEAEKLLFDTLQDVELLQLVMNWNRLEDKTKKVIIKSINEFIL